MRAIRKGDRLPLILNQQLHSFSFLANEGHDLGNLFFQPINFCVEQGILLVQALNFSFECSQIVGS